MKRLVVLAAGAALLLATGCTHGGEASLRKAFGVGPAARGPGAGERDKKAVPIPPASLAVAERVELVGRKVITQNTFIGIEPMFMAIGVKDRVLFHRGAEQLFISEGLVEKCRTDAELAAVLCAEMGQMVAEMRAAKALRPGAGSPAGLDATAAARDLLQGAGYSPAELDRIEPLLKPSERGETLRKQLGGSAPAPSWDK